LISGSVSNTGGFGVEGAPVEVEPVPAVKPASPARYGTAQAAVDDD
jgi:hypothetical protein